MRRVVITGAAGGLGRALVRAFLAQPDTQVHALCRRVDQLSGLAGEPRLVVHAVDLASPASVAALEVPESVDVLIHSAAAGANMDADDARGADWAHYLRINVTAAVELTDLCAPRMPRGSAVFFVNSGLGLKASPTSAPYSGSKAAIKSYADSLRPRFNTRGIRVTTVYPGQINTALLEHNTAAVGIDFEPQKYIQPGELADLMVSLVNAGPSLQLTDVAVRPAVEPW